MLKIYRDIWSAKYSKLRILVCMLNSLRWPLTIALTMYVKRHWFILCHFLFLFYSIFSSFFQFSLIPHLIPQPHLQFTPSSPTPSNSFIHCHVTTMTTMTSPPPQHNKMLNPNLNKYLHKNKNSNKKRERRKGWRIEKTRTKEILRSNLLKITPDSFNPYLLWHPCWPAHSSWQHSPHINNTWLSRRLDLAKRCRYYLHWLFLPKAITTRSTNNKNLNNRKIRPKIKTPKWPNLHWFMLPYISFKERLEERLGLQLWNVSF